MLNGYLLLSYILAILLFLGTPGPVTVMVVNSSIKGGFLSALATIAGTNTASLILITISFIVISGVISVNESYLTWLTMIGALYIIYFAINILRTKSEELHICQHDTNNKKQLIEYFTQGFLVGISNPKDILFFIAFFPTFFAISNKPIISMVILTGIWIVLDYGILSIYAKIFSTIKKSSVISAINKLCGVILLMIALYAFFSTFSKIFMF